ncbi:MAG: M23 family metallopeptidase [Deltaproteobacteria bacterium]|jgi:murein DD-endopeptidase MepM/ murein hydrolase activator NlpD|nr:M23 family metallopeptidase [Deltaproteobacteria bacterium]MBW2540587.1 M23 family metallopeptidase [Deltaproteobacteria bacterium]
MDSYSIIVVAEETAPVRRFEIRKALVRRLAWVAGGLALLLTACLADYIYVRIAHSELKMLRVEVAEQQSQIDSFDATLEGVRSTLANIGEFERKVRIIANLPGSAATGGEEVAEVGVDSPEPEAQLDVPGTSEPTAGSPPRPDKPSEEPQARVETDSGEPLILALHRTARRLGEVAASQELSLAEVASQLESKRAHLAATPAIWPAKGWLTSRFGTRISPFTNQKQFHAGIDIAGERGTDVVAPAQGKVVFSGNRGPLGKSLIIDHGYGVRTQYGHSDDIYVKTGETVQRGQRIASLGNSGRSTGPHLHYVVEVKGKAVNPLDYIFD